MTKIFNPKKGYNQVAHVYDKWYWKQFWKQFEVPFIEYYMRGFYPDSILDAGCGIGDYTKFFADRKCPCNGRYPSHVVGIDISDEMIKVARNSTIFSTVNYCIGDIYDLPEEWTNQFECVFTARCLSHIRNYTRVLKEFDRVLKPGGRLIITDISPEHNYTSTGVRLNEKEKVQIRIFKHKTFEIEKAFTKTNLQINTFNEICFKDLPQNYLNKAFESLRAGCNYTPDQKLLYIIIATKKEKV